MLLSSPFAITPNMKTKCLAAHEDTPRLSCSLPHPSVFADKVDVTGSCVLENSLLTLPVPGLSCKEERGFVNIFTVLEQQRTSHRAIPQPECGSSLGTQAGSSSLQVGMIWGADLALLPRLCGCSQQDNFHSKRATAVNKRGRVALQGLRRQ